MIEGYCRTNLDDSKREEWPTVFVAVPQKGDRMKSKNGKELKVCGITHIMVRSSDDWRFPYPNPRTSERYPYPVIEVELNK